MCLEETPETRVFIAGSPSRAPAVALRVTQPREQRLRPPFGMAGRGFGKQVAHTMGTNNLNGVVRQPKQHLES